MVQTTRKPGRRPGTENLNKPGKRPGTGNLNKAELDALLEAATTVRGVLTTEKKKRKEKKGMTGDKKNMTGDEAYSLAGGGLAEATAKLKAKGFKDGGMVVKDKTVAMDKSPNSGLITVKGFGASRRT